MTTPINCNVDPCQLLHVYMAHMRKISTCMFGDSCIIYENNKHRLDECRTHSLEQKHVKIPATVTLSAKDEFVIAQSSLIGVGGIIESAKIPTHLTENRPQPKLSVKMPETSMSGAAPAASRPYSPVASGSPRITSPNYFTDPLAGKCHYFYQGDFAVTHAGKQYPIHVCGNPVRNPQHYYCESCFQEIRKRQ